MFAGCTWLRVMGLKLLLVSFLLLEGCATSSVFLPYPARMQPIKQDLEARQYAKAQKALAPLRSNADKILYLMERGRVSQLGNDLEASIKDYETAMEAIAVSEDKAKISLTETAAQGSALLTNDNAIPYYGEAYEHIFLHQFQALNYLFSHKLEDALVEVRRANLGQREALERHNRELAQIQDKVDRYQQSNPDFKQAYSAMASVAARVKNSFQNAYSFYVTGLIYEISGEPNDAYIDYKKALEIFPDNVTVQKDVLRLAKQLGMSDDYAYYKKAFAPEPEKVGADEGELVVLFEHGFAPVKMEIGIGIIVDNHLQKVAFPIYPSQWQAIPALSVYDQSQGNRLAPLGETSSIVQVQALATKALQEHLPGMLLRQVLRIIAKRKVSEQTGKALGPWGRFAADVYNVISENADRRSWLTLPNDAQIMRKPLRAGEHRLELNNGLAREVVPIKIEAGKKTILHVVATGKTFHLMHITL
jgi:hypothetical protein